MSDKKYTLGPWVAKYNGHYYDITPLGDSQHLAGTHGNSYLDGSESANANLIAAAPELLEILEMVCKKCESDKYLYDMLNGCEKAKEACSGCPTRKAIAKAHGETK